MTRDSLTNKSGFSLVELLVVVAFIALLVALLVPVISNAKAKGEAAKCVSRLRQMAIAATSYAASNRGQLPLAYEWDRSAGVNWQRDWDVTMIDGIPTPGLLWQGDGVAEIQQCPSFSGKGNTDSPYSGYNYNSSYLGGGRKIRDDGVVVQHTPSANLASIINASTCAIFGDGEYSAGANKFMRSPKAGQLDVLGPAANIAGTQGFRHLGKTHIAFVDGHVEALERGYASVGASSQEGLQYGFISTDNSLYDYE